MMEELSRSLDFKYQIVNPPDSAWGVINETGQWNGLTGMASRGDADVPGIEVIGVISDILPNFARFQACGICYVFLYNVLIVINLSSIGLAANSVP